MCKHEFDGRDRIVSNNGLIFVIYKCTKCDEEFDQCIGETWKPNENGEFEY